MLSEENAALCLFTARLKITKTNNLQVQRYMSNERTLAESFRERNSKLERDDRAFTVELRVEVISQEAI